jgi:NAD dependent epimerase/dehydratase family enzyme
MSWIHADDLADLFAFAVEQASVQGALNGTAPNPVTNAEFTRELAGALHRPAVFPVPLFALRLLYGEMAEVVAGSQRVLPRAAEAAGFRFGYPELRAALEELLG